MAGQAAARVAQRHTHAGRDGATTVGRAELLVRNNHRLFEHKAARDARALRLRHIVADRAELAAIRAPFTHRTFV